MVAHPQADTIEAMSRAAINFSGNDPDAAILHGRGWNPHTSEYLDTGVQTVPRWMTVAQNAAVMLAMWQNMSGPSIVLQMTKDCPREDCELAPSEVGFSNSIGHTNSWRCLSCRRVWAVHYPEPHQRQTFDKHGTAKLIDRPSPEVREQRSPGNPA